MLLPLLGTVRSSSRGEEETCEERRGIKRAGQWGKGAALVVVARPNITGNFLKEFDRFLYRREYFSPSFIFRNVSRSCYDLIVPIYANMYAAMLGA